MLKQILSASVACMVCVSLATTAFAAAGGYSEGGMPLAGGEYDKNGVFVGSGGTSAAAPTANAAANTNSVYVEGIEHTIVAGDTLGHLSVNYFGNFNYTDALYAANTDVFAKTGGAMTPGMQLFIPDKIGNASRYNLPVAGADEALYTVKGGETLGTIAQEQYPNIINAANVIYQRNSDRLVNVHSIYEGQIIVLPVIEYTEQVVNNTAPVGGNGLPAGMLG